jgi:hypothetical protein
MVADLQATEYRFLQHVPDHWNVVAVLAVVPAAPLVEALVLHMPEGAREAATVVSDLRVTVREWDSCE